MIPNFFNADNAGAVFLPRYSMIYDAAIVNKDRYRTSGRKTNVLLTIDAQNSFCIPGASLYVPGAEKDSARLAAFIYRNMDEIDAIQNTLDTHVEYQIFFSSFWVDAAGTHPDPFTVIRSEDVRIGKWRAVGGKEDTEIAEAYTYALEEKGRYALMIWPYHTMRGSIDHAIIPILDEAYRYFRLCTNRILAYTEKGASTYAESYSAFSPEIRQVQVGQKLSMLGQFNNELMETILSYERIFIAGQASSHCVKATIEDILDYADVHLSRKDLNRFYILEDCMSPVISPDIDFPAIARKALERFQNVGMNLIKSTEKI